MASENDIPTFFHDLDSRFKDAVKLDESTATRFNVFRYIASDELKLSSLMRDLFDPRGPHGQGELFLRCFLKAVKIGHLSIDDDCRAKCERLNVPIAMAWPGSFLNRARLTRNPGTPTEDRSNQ